MRAREGAIAATVGMSLTVMAGVLALAFDLGKLYSVSTEFDNAADAAALAGATQLDQSVGSCARAAAAAANALLRNEETFADNPDPINPLIYIDPVLVNNRNGHIRFLSTLAKDASGTIIGDYIDTADTLSAGLEPDVNSTDISVCDANAEYIEVTVNLDSLGNPYEVGFIFAPVVGAVARASPIGYAIAALHETFCDVTPMMMCALDPDDTGPLTPSDFWNELTANPENYRGRGLWMKSGLNNVQWGSGDFGFLAQAGPLEAICGGGANLLRCAFGMANPPVECTGLEDLETEPGNNSVARQGFNVRFGIYQGGGGIDRGDPQWQPAANRSRVGCETNRAAVGGTVGETRVRRIPARGRSIPTELRSAVRRRGTPRLWPQRRRMPRWAIRWTPARTPPEGLSESIATRIPPATTIAWAQRSGTSMPIFVSITTWT